MLEAKVNGSGATRAAVELVAPDASPSEGDGEVETLALANLPFAEEIYFQFLRDPGSVAPEWRRLFEQLDGGNGQAGANGLSAAAVIPPPRSRAASSAERRPRPPAPSRAASRCGCSPSVCSGWWKATASGGTSSPTSIRSA